MATIDDSDVPETGAVFTFGRSRFADNLANKFWIRNDRIVHVTCGDEHSVVVTERGRLYAFGTNDWGQLGLGHTKAANKPSFIKALKPNKMVLAACGRTHTIVASESGKVFSFGAGGDGQLGHGNTDGQYSPKQIEGLPVDKVKILSCGVYHSAALFESGDLYTWGSGSDGQTGHEEEETLQPKILKFDGKVKWISCGYYHTAAVTDDGKLYTFGENENGKLGITGSQGTSRPQPVATEDGHFVAVACGSGHTVALTKEGKVFSFGGGSRGQLGQGTRTQELCEPKMVQQLSHLKMKFISCGDCHSAAITENGKLYTFGDGRHGKLAQGEECFSNLFRPQIVARFAEFNVQSVSCGGCHTLVIATMREHDVSDVEDEEDSALNSSMMSSYSHASMPEANATMRLQGLSNTVPLVSPRDKRRQKESENLANSFSGSFRHVSRNDLPAIGLSLDRSRLPCINKLKDSPEDKTNQASNKKKNEELSKSSREGKSTDSRIEEKNIKNSQKVSDELEFKKNLENELDDNDSRNIKSRSTDGHKHVQIKENETDQSRISDKKETLQSKSKEESEEEEDESGDEEESEEGEEGSDEEEEEEEEDEDSNAKIDKTKSDKSSKLDVNVEKIKAPGVTKKPEDLKKNVEEEEEEEEDEEEDDDEDDDEESEEEDDDEEEEEDDDYNEEEDDDDDEEEDEEEEDEEEAKVTDGKVEALVSDSKVDGKSVEGDMEEIKTDKSSKEDKKKDKGDKNKDKEDKKKDKEDKSKDKEGKKKDKQDKKKGKDGKENEENEDKDVNDEEELNSKENDNVEAEKNNNNLEDAEKIENTENNKATTEEDKKKEKQKFGGLFGRKKQPAPVVEKSKDEIDGPAAKTAPKKTGKSGVCTVL